MNVVLVTLSDRSEPPRKWARKFGGGSPVNCGQTRGEFIYDGEEAEGGHLLCKRLSEGSLLDGPFVGRVVLPE